MSWINPAWLDVAWIALFAALAYAHYQFGPLWKALYRVWRMRRQRRRTAYVRELVERRAYAELSRQVYRNEVAWQGTWATTHSERWTG